MFPLFNIYKALPIFISFYKFYKVAIMYNYDIYIYVRIFSKLLKSLKICIVLKTSSLRARRQRSYAI